MQRHQREVTPVSDEFVIFDSDSDQPATHAIVIGVGDYPHLIGGSGTRTDSHDGMKQLTSPPVSARAFANWLLHEFHNPDAPLGSVQLLLSEQVPRLFDLPGGTQADIGLANLDNIKKAVTAWRRRADLHLDNMTIFYFCGHGISEGNSMVLLPSDFGSEDNAFAHSIDFLNVYNAMEQYQAQKQVFFVDACRASSDSLHGNRGVNILQDRPRGADGTRIGPVYYATLKDELAYGQTHEASYFTTALLDCLSHFGADDQEGDWRTSNFGLAEALDHVMDQFIHAGSKRAQTPDSTEVWKKFAINHLNADPHALLYVRSQPEESFPDSCFRCVDSSQSEQVRGPVDPAEEPEREEWMFRITSGQIKVEAFQPKNGQVASLGTGEVLVLPPYKRFRLDLA